MSGLPAWLIAALPMLFIVMFIGAVFFLVCAIIFPDDEEGPRGGGMVE